MAKPNAGEEVFAGWECKMIEGLWNSSLGVCYEANMQLPHNSITSLLTIYLREMKT